MTEVEFRVKHSELIEYYQLIEMHLKGICAALDVDKENSWFDKLDDFEADPLGKLLKKIKKLQSKKNYKLLKDDDFRELDELRKKRNYWVHQCFSTDDHVIFRKGILREASYCTKICSDWREAIEWDEKITEIGRPLLNEKVDINEMFRGLDFNLAIESKEITRVKKCAKIRFLIESS